MLHYEYFMFPTPLRDQLNRIYFSLSVAHMVSEISGAIPSSSHERFLEWRFAVKFMTDGLESPVPEG